MGVSDSQIKVARGKNPVNAGRTGYMKRFRRL